MFLNIDRVEKSRTAIHDDGETIISYGELSDFVNRVEALALERGIVFTLCENCAGALAGYIAFESVKIVPLLLSAAIDEGLLAELERTYTPMYYWVPKMTAIEYPGEEIFSGYGYSLFKTQNNPYNINDQLSLLMPTSGSTGSPKLVRYKYGNLEANAKNVAAVFGWTEREKCIADLPIQYTMGLNVINSHLVVGAEILLIKSNLMSARFWDFVKENKGTNFTGVPYSYEIMTKLRFMRMKLPDLYTLAEGGGKLTDEMFLSLVEYTVKNNKRFCATFGTTETSARMAFLDPKYAMEKIGSIGKAIPEGELFLLDEDGREITEMEARGELGYRGANVTMGYSVCRDDLSKGDEWKGTYLTGDIARRDKDGFYFIVGRKSRFLKLYGLRVNLDQTERIIKEKYDCECACSGTDKSMYVYVTDEKVAADVASFLGKKLNMLAATFEVRLVPEIKKNETGKPQYRKIDEEWT